MLSADPAHTPKLQTPRPFRCLPTCKCCTRVESRSAGELDRHVHHMPWPYHRALVPRKQVAPRRQKPVSLWCSDVPLIALEKRCVLWSNRSVVVVRRLEESPRGRQFRGQPPHQMREVGFGGTDVELVRVS